MIQFNKLQPAIFEKSIEKSLEYSEQPEQLKILLKELSIDYKFIAYGKHFEDDTESRYIINIEIKRNNVSINFDFGLSTHDSILLLWSTDQNNSDYLELLVQHHVISREQYFKMFEISIPNYFLLRRKVKDIYDNMLYSILACINSDYYIPESFDDFCNEFGYNNDSIKDLNLHQRCLKQSKKLHQIFTDENIEAMPY